MSSATDSNHLSHQPTRKGIPAARKHVYFYALLFLGTVVTHNIWRQTIESAAPTPEAASAVEMQQVVTTAQRLTP